MQDRITLHTKKVLFKLALVSILVYNKYFTLVGIYVLVRGTEYA